MKRVVCLLDGQKIIIEEISLLEIEPAQIFIKMSEDIVISVVDGENMISGSFIFVWQKKDGIYQRVRSITPYIVITNGELAIMDAPSKR